MVEVVDPTPDPKIIKHKSCTNCGVRLAYLPIDIKSRTGTDYSGGSDGSTWIVCPSCNANVILRSW